MLTHIGTQQIETERLILRRFLLSDDEAMLKHWIANKEMQALYVVPAYTTKDSVGELLSGYQDSYKDDDYYRWAIVLKENNECIGEIAYWTMDSENHFGEIGYCIGVEFQSKGYATEATKAAIEFGFTKINLHKVQICHMAINTPSRKVIEKVGCLYDGTIRDYFFMNGQYIDRVIHSILKSEFEQLK